MSRIPNAIAQVTAVVALTLASLGAAWADKPEWAGGGKGREGRESRDGRPDHSEKGARNEAAPRGGSDLAVTIGFSAQDRLVVEGYWREQARAGHCPPGLAKKGNGCLPPGQAKAWRVGQALPAGVTIREVSPELRVRLPVPPARHRYVEVAGDILLIAVGTSMVVDAVENILGR